MGEAVYDFRCQRPRAVRVFGTAFKIDGNYQGRYRCGRRRDFITRMDFRFDFSAARRTDKCLINVRRQLYFAVAFPNVAFISQANLYQSVVS